MRKEKLSCHAHTNNIYGVPFDVVGSSLVQSYRLKQSHKFNN